MSSEIRLGGGVTPLVLILLIILVASLAVISMTLKRIRSYLLLKTGLTAVGTVRAKNLLSRSSGREWYEIVYEFVANQRPYQLKDRPHYTERINEDEQRTILYNRKDPHKATVLDDSALAIILEEAGGPSSGSLLSTAVVLLIPITSMILIAISIYYEFFG